MDSRFTCLALLVLLRGYFVRSGADDDTECVQKLLPCQPYLLSPSPPATCCAPMKQAVTDDSNCLCNLFNNPDFLSGFNLTQEEALQLPKNCGAQVDINKCKATGASGNSAPSPASTSNSTTSASNSTGSTESSSSSSNPRKETSEKTNAAAHVGSSACIASFLALIVSAF